MNISSAKLYKTLGVWLALLTNILQGYSQIDVDHVVSIGRNALHFNDYIVSIGYFNQVIEARPWMALPYYYRSIAKINLEDYTGAAADASLCLERNQFISKAYLIRGVARQHLGQKEQAIADYIKGLELVPNDIGMRLNLALAYSQNKANDQAEEALTTLLRYAPKSTEPYTLGASIALERGDTTQALQRIDAALALDSMLAMPYKLRAHIYASREQLTTSLRDLNKAIELEPQMAALYTARGIVHYRSHKLHSAMQDYSKALELDSKNGVARYNRALLRTLVGELDVALEDWNEVLRLETNNHTARYNRVLVAQKLGHWQQALQDLDVVLDVYPSFIEGFLLRTQLRKKLGDHRGAERDYWHAWDLQRNKQYRAAAHTQARSKQNSLTRTEQDRAIDKYEMLIEEEIDLSGYKPQYTSRVRGRIQDRDTEIVPCPPYYLTYFTQINPTGKLYWADQHSAKLLEETSQSSPNYTLKLYSRPQALSETEINELRTIIQTDTPHNTAQAPYSHLHRGVAYTLLQDYDRAIELFDKALEANDQFVLAYLARALAFMRKQEVSMQQESGGANRVHLDETQTEGGPSSLNTISLPQGLTLKAQRDLDKAISLAPSFAFAYYNRAVLHAHQGHKAEAIADYSRALKLAPRMAEGYFNRGLLLLSLGKKQEGIVDLSKAGELGLYQAYNIIKRISKE